MSRTCEKCSEPAKVKFYNSFKHVYEYFCSKHAEEVLKRVVGERKK